MAHENKSKALMVRSRKVHLNGGEQLQFLAEVEHLGVTPDAYYAMVRNVNEFIKVGAEMRDQFELLEEEQTVDGEPIQTFANFGKKKAMMQGRMNFDTRYFNKQECFVVISSQGNEEVRDNYLRKHEEVSKKY